MAKKKTSNQPKAQSTNAKNNLGQKINKVTNRRGRKNKNNQSQQQQQNVELPDVEDQEESVSASQQNQQGSNSNDNSQNQQDEDNDQSDESQSESSITPVKPQNYAVKQMQFRQRRGTKMNYLMNRKKEQDEDPFWAQHKGIFGDLNGPDDQDQEDYVQSSSGKDQFDSDFGQTQSEHDDEPQQNQKKMVDEFDQQKQKQRKKRAQLMKKVNAYKQKPEKTQKEKEKTPKIQNSQKLQKIKQDQKKQIVSTPILKKPKAQQKVQQQIGNRFIHQIFTQQQLLGEAAHTQYYNWLSLKKLISIETQKKDFTRKVKHVDGSKIIYKNKLNQDGNQCSSYQLCGVTVNDISDLTNYWQAK